MSDLQDADHDVALIFKGHRGYEWVICGESVARKVDQRQKLL